MPVYLWVVTALCVWVGSLMFAAYGLFMGYLLPTENVMQILAFTLVLFAFAGGLFVPLSQFPQAFQPVAKFTPLYGLNQLVHAPLLGGSVHVAWVVNASPGWPSSPAARSGASAWTPPGSDRQSRAASAALCPNGAGHDG